LLTDRSVYYSMFINPMKISEELLKLIKKVGELTSEMAIMWQEERKITRSSYYYFIHGLQSQGLVEKSYKGNSKDKRKKISYKLTEKGKNYQLLKPALKQKRTDGFSTVIIFDIPEKMSRERTILRRFLVKNEFTQLQKSVLISPNELSKDIIELIGELKVRPYLTVLSSKVFYF